MEIQTTRRNQETECVRVARPPRPTRGETGGELPAPPGRTGAAEGRLRSIFLVHIFHDCQIGSWFPKILKTALRMLHFKIKCIQLLIDPVPLLPSPKCPNSFPPSPSPSPALTNKWTNKKQVATVSMLNVSSPLTVASQKSARRPEEQRVPPGLPRGFALILAWAGEGGGCRGCIFPSS